MEDNPGDARLIAEMIVDAGGGFELRHVQTVREANECLAHGGIDAVLFDLTLPTRAPAHDARAAMAR